VNPLRRSILGIAALAVAGKRAWAQAPGRTFRIAILDQWANTTRSAPARRMVEAMADLGYVEGRNVRFSWHHAQGDLARLAEHAREVAKARPDAIVAMGAISTHAAAEAAPTIPIVAWTDDPARRGLSHPSLMPSRNVTGFADLGEERARKGLELLKALIPDLRRFGILVPAGNAFAAETIPAFEAVAGSLGVQVASAAFATRGEIESAFNRFRREGVRAALAWPAPGLMTFNETIQLALRHAIGLSTEGLGARFGALISFSPDIDGRRFALQLEKILRGVPVASIPFERPERFVVAINRKTAAALGLTISPDMMLRVDRFFDEWESSP
jgi:putative ABC transport system substrate-binding protein